MVWLLCHWLARFAWNAAQDAQYHFDVMASLCAEKEVLVELHIA